MSFTTPKLMTLESQGDTKISLSMIRLPSFNSLVKNSFKVEKSSNGFFISDKFAPTAQENDLSIEGLHPFDIFCYAFIRVLLRL